MAHFAEIDESGKVIRVVVIDNPHEGGGNDFLKYDLCLGGNWVQTSYNNNFRKNYAGVGYDYDAIRDAFISPQSYPSWTLNETTCNWEPPTPCPTTEEEYRWDESTLNWVLK
jgi:hypothetical protein